MQTITKNLNTVKPLQLIDEATVAIATCRYEEALHLLNTFLLFQPGNLDARLKKGLCYLYNEQFDEARQLFNEVLDETGGYAEAYYCFAEYYKVMLDYDFALTYITDALMLDEENATYHRLAAELCYLQQDYIESFGLINKAIVINPFKEEYYYWRAIILVRLNKLHVAINDLNRSISINPQFTEAYRKRAHLRMRTGEVDAALQDLRTAQRLELLQAEQTRHAA